MSGLDAQKFLALEALLKLQTEQQAQIIILLEQLLWQATTTQQSVAHAVEKAYHTT